MRGRSQNGTAEAFELVAGPGQTHPEVTIAVFLFDRAGDRLFMRFRPDLRECVGEEELDVVAATEEHFQTLIQEGGATKVIDWMQDTLSNYMRLIGPASIPFPRDWKLALDRLYETRIRGEHAASVERS